MRRTPQSENEQPVRPTRPAPTRQPQRRTPATDSRRSAFVYRTDERPEVPKIRRASLYVREDEPITTAHRVPRVRPAPPVEQAAVRRVRRRDDEELEQQEDGGVRHTTGRMVAARSRRIVYEPAPPAKRPMPASRRRRQQKPLRASIQELSHKQSVILIVTMSLVALILFPIIINAALNNYRHSSNTLLPLQVKATATQSARPPVVAPAGPHGLVITPEDTDHPAPPVFAQAAYLLDADTGATLYAYKPFDHLPVLSTTKLMTAALAAEHGNPDQAITITPTMQNEINQLSPDSALFGVKQGEAYSLRDMLYGLLYVSGNDAAIVIANTIGGNLQHFVDMMNQRAAQLGLHDTHFMNPHGLLMDNHYSSAHDLAFLGRYALSLPLIHQISSGQHYHITNDGRHQDHDLYNENQFQWWYPGVDGGKTGFDGISDFVQVVSCTRNHHHLIGVVIHTIDWWTDMRDLMNWGFNSFNWISPYDVDQQHPIPYDTDWNYFSKDRKDLTIPASGGGRYYIYTGYSISGPVLAFYDKNGGLNHFGYPTSMPTAPSSTTTAQRFEHATILCNTSTKQCKAV